MHLIDYIEQNLATFDEQPFNIVDAAALSQAAMLDVAGLVPGVPNTPLTLVERLRATMAPAAPPVRFGDLLRAEHFDHLFLGLVPQDIKRCLYALAASPRFRELTLSCATAHVDDAVPTQFGALCFSWRDAFTYVGFQGTDAPLPGWRENFDMAWRSPVEAQVRAAAYLQDVAAHVPGRLYVGGHSKGGNLALYAALTCSDELRDRIAGVWVHDAPGFARGLFSARDLERLAGRVRHVVPESAVVGMLLTPAVEPEVASCSAAGLYQHAVFTWEIEGDHFASATLDERSRGLHEVLETWLAQTEPERVQRVVDIMFDVVDAAGYTDARTMLDGGAATLQRLADAVWRLPAQKKTFLSEVAGELSAIAWERAGRDIASGIAELMGQKQSV